MAKYNDFDASDNAKIIDLIASSLFRLAISAIAALGVLLIPVFDVKCLLLMFYLIYNTFNVIPIFKSFKSIFWDFFIKENNKTLSNICYFRATFQMVETIINYLAIYFLFKAVIL